jgi:hypothetical protein
MKKIFLIIGALLAALFATAQQTCTLQQSVDAAQVNNGNLKYGVTAKKSIEIAYRQAQLNVLPKPNASASQVFSFGGLQLADGTYQNNNSTKKIDL